MLSDNRLLLSLVIGCVLRSLPTVMYIQFRILDLLPQQLVLSLNQQVSLRQLGHFFIIGVVLFLFKVGFGSQGLQLCDQGLVLALETLIRLHGLLDIIERLI